MLVIFDFDGPLRAVAWEGIFEGYRAIILHLGLRPEYFFTDIVSFKEWFDHDWLHNDQRIEEHLSMEDREQFHTERRNVFHAAYDRYVAVYPWVSQFMRALAERHALAVCSSAQHASIRNDLGAAAECFAMIVGRDDVAKGKPHPEGINNILTKLGFFPDETIMVGDSHIDVEAAQAAGVKVVCVTWGMYDRATLERYRVPLIDTPEDLHAYLT